MSRVDDEEALHRAYDDSGTYLLHLQRAVEPHDLFVRCIGFGPQARLVRYDPGAPLHDRYTMDDGGLPEDATPHPDRHDDDDQLVLRLGVQLVRGPATGRRVAPDRLRQRLPRLAGDLAALPLPVARRRQPALVDLLCRHQAADAASTSTGRRTSRSPTPIVPTPRSWRRTRPSPADASRPTSSSRSAPPTSPTSTGSCGSSSATRWPVTPCGSRSRRCSRATRSTTSPSSSGSASRRGGRDDPPASASRR